jgi:hypothetical protein
MFVLVTTAKKVLAVALGEPARDDATFSHPAARNTKLDSPRRSTAKNRRPKLRLFEKDCEEEFGIGVADASPGIGVCIVIGGLGGGGNGESGGGGSGESGGETSDIDELSLSDAPESGGGQGTATSHRVPQYSCGGIVTPPTKLASSYFASTKSFRV